VYYGHPFLQQIPYIYIFITSRTGAFWLASLACMICCTSRGPNHTACSGVADKPKNVNFKEITAISAGKSITKYNYIRSLVCVGKSYVG
jgi:hypothetical protein